MNTSKRQQMPVLRLRGGGGPTVPRQRGAVLVVGLIILLIMTILGVQAMRSNVSQERMAFNMRERNLAFQAAEAALRVGESTRPFPVAGVDLVDPVNWVAGEETGSLVSFDDGLAADPLFHVGPPQYIRIGISIPPEYRLIYPVAARGEGRQAGSVVVLQSGYEPPN